MNEVYIITAGRYMCTSQYHQDWRQTGHGIVGVFTDKKKFEEVWAKRPRGWHETHPDDKYAEEDDISIEWEYDEYTPNEMRELDI